MLKGETMRSSLKFMGVWAGISASALVACSERPTSAKPASQARPEVPAKPASLALIDISKSHPPNADDDCKNAKKRLFAVVIDIPDVNDLNTAKQELYVTDPDGNVPEGDPIALMYPMPNAHSAADVNAGPFLQKPKDVVLLQLKLTQKDVYFLEGKDTILTDDAHHGQMFCVKEDIDVGTKVKTVKFYVRYMKGISSSALVGAYTFSVIRNGQIVRVTVDPEVQNNGFQ